MHETAKISEREQMHEIPFHEILFADDTLFVAKHRKIMAQMLHTIE